MNITHDASATTLRIAKSIAGGIDALARHLRVPKKQLASWIEGEVETPPTVVVRCVGFLASAHSK